MTTSHQDTLSAHVIQDAFDASMPQSYARDTIKARLAHELVNLPTVKQQIIDIIGDIFVDHYFTKFNLPSSDDKALQELDKTTSETLFSSIDDEITEAFHTYAYNKIDVLLEDCSKAAA
ncbi:MAG: hypothetical protein CMF49_02650 [Legionellales bacterium]|nr:hypothetical protein [Legionellales bacterium]